MTMKSRRFRAIVSVAGVLCAGGCYEQTVESRGLGSSRGAVEPVYRSETALDRAFDSVFGDPAPSREKSWRAMPSPDVPKMRPAEGPK